MEHSTEELHACCHDYLRADQTDFKQRPSCDSLIQRIQPKLHDNQYSNSGALRSWILPEGPIKQTSSNVRVVTLQPRTRLELVLVSNVAVNTSPGFSHRPGLKNVPSIVDSETPESARS